MSASEPDTLRILVTGARGQVGSALPPALAHLGQVTAVGRHQLNLESDDSIRACVLALRPGLIVHTAAYTAVDKAESEPELARRINAEAVATLAHAAGQVGAAMLHYSTDYVFDGAKPAPYVEQDPPHPLSVYGQTKLAAERALAAAPIASIVLRVSWVYAATGKNFLATILRLAHERPELRIVDDQRGAPTSAPQIAHGTALLLEHALRHARATGATLQQVLAGRRGVYHMVAQGETTWCGFARAILRAAGIAGVPVHPIATSEYKTAARRPLNSRLNCEKIAAAFGVRLSPWDTALQEVLAAVQRPPS